MQQDNFYIIGGTPELTVEYNGDTLYAKNMNIKLKSNDIFTFENLISKNGLIIYGSENSRYREWKANKYRDWETDRKSTRLNSSHITRSRMPSSA